MNDAWHKRLKDALARKGWTAKRLADEAQLPKDNVYKWLRGEVQAPRGRALTTLATALDVTPEWLVFGISTSPDGDKNDAPGLSLVALPLLTMRQLHEQLSDVVEFSGMQAAERVLAPEAIAGPRSFAVQVDDLAMAPSIPRGAIVICDPDQSPEPGRYVLAISHNARAAVVRRYRQLSGDSPEHCDLIPENADFPTLSLKSSRSGRIVGRIVYVMIPV